MAEEFFAQKQKLQDMEATLSGRMKDYNDSEVRQYATIIVVNPVVMAYIHGSIYTIYVEMQFLSNIECSNGLAHTRERLATAACGSQRSCFYCAGKQPVRA